MNNKINLSVFVVIFLFTILLMSSVLAYHPGTQGNPVQQETPKDPGNLPTFIIVGVVVAIAVLIYWKLKFNPS